ncbi:helix-turn-helix domain-containing protein [Eggerthella lenta]|uniref:helix-turn-helix domain-containing protein n=2 Tax=Eggerthellaceae TaxID=1643826 RepID=UPI0022E06D61|nr:helix-turn-helix domain-containing protein [Eggerthella lenta]
MVVPLPRLRWRLDWALWLAWESLGCSRGHRAFISAFALIPAWGFEREGIDEPSLRGAWYRRCAHTRQSSSSVAAVFLGTGEVRQSHCSERRRTFDAFDRLQLLAVEFRHTLMRTRKVGFDVMRVGYAGKKALTRESEMRLERAGCERIHQGSLKSLLGNMQEGDVVVVESLKSLGKSMSTVAANLMAIQDANLSIIALDEGVDSTGDGAGFLEHVKLLASVEAPSGHSGGRPKADTDAISDALAMHASGQYRTSEICEATGLSRATLYRYIKQSQAAADT